MNLALTSSMIINPIFLIFLKYRARCLWEILVRVEEYTVIGEKIHFSDYAKNCATFDLWIGDKKRDMIRVAGETYPSKNCLGTDCIQLVLDQKFVAFRNVHPRTFHLILKDWWQIQEFHLMADFELSYPFPRFTKI